MSNQDNFVRTANMDTAKLKAIVDAVYAADLNLRAWYGHFVELSDIASWATEMGCATVALTPNDLERLYGIQQLLKRQAEKALNAAA